MPLILRLLLCLVLVLNGTRTAVASHVMAQDAAPMVGTHLVASTATSVQAPCHDWVAPDALHQLVSTAVDGGDHTAPPAPAGDHGGNDCCGADQCQCDCAQHHCCAALVTVASLTPYLPQPAHLGRMVSAHTPPALANPIRPPIV